jgi:hypothetical protein
MKISVLASIALVASTIHPAHAQTACPGSTLNGVVRDSTQALIPGASITLDAARTETSGSDGRFRFLCTPAGAHHLSASFDGFAPREIDVKTPLSSQVQLILTPQAVETEVVVNGDDSSAPTATGTGASLTIADKQLQALADDPDDLLRELQQLAAVSGGNPANTTIAVDGFQGTSKLPPKSSIAYIRVNPDQFSAEYREPPFGDGRVEVYTKPGQSKFHGALFTTNGSPWENARDPFSTSKAAIGKQRYGFELSGPVRKVGSDFALTLEHRSIDNFAVVNAITLDPSGNAASTVANVATPQRLWIGSARLGWQLSPRNILLTSYSANVNHLQSVGVGGTALAENGYDSQQYEHILRISNVTTVSPRLMHEARFSLRWDGETDAPASSAPQVQVAGAFTGGGATLGPQQLHEINIEVDDDAIVTWKKHTLKAGTQFMLYRERQQLTSNFNGTYTFGGGTAPILDASNQPLPGQTQTITGIEQYRRALLHLPGGSPTAYSAVAGVPTVNFTQVQDALYIQDDWNVGHGFHIASGLRYFLQNNPTVLNSLTPRISVLWSPDKKGTWTLHARYGLFAGRFSQGLYAEVQREDNLARITSTVYNPVYGNPSLGATPIYSARQFNPNLGNLTWGAENLGGTHALRGGWNLSLDLILGRIWNDTRSVNINSPLNGSPTGPRPGAANLNLLQVQNSGQGNVNVIFAGVEQHSFKRIQFFFGGVHLNLFDDTDDTTLSSPQSSTSNVGEFARRTNQPAWEFFGNATLTLPAKLQWSANFNAGGDAHYNITTGFDNNGDGNFNDRPQYATAGTPGAISTPYGLLVASGGTGVFPRNKGVLPWTVHLDSNLQRAFPITRNAKADHPQTLTVNLRSSNVLNHTNVTTIGGVLGSPLFGVPYAADNGRRVEAGLRYTF